MFNLSRPSFSATESFQAAVATIRDGDRRAVYLGAAGVVESACTSYDGYGAAFAFHLAAGEAFDVPSLGKKEMVLLYDPQFSKRAGTKKIRSALKNAAPNSLCPYCGEGQAIELDHYLPKESFAAISVHPANLVPSCGDCNRKKLAYRPSADDPAVLHPYFDTAFSINWLKAKVEEDSIGKPVVVFRVQLPYQNVALESRIERHMDVFQLYDRFSVWAGQSLDNFETLLASPYGSSMTIRTARKHLRRTAVQQSGGRVNSWESATHEAMRSSAWYLESYLGLA